MKKVSLIISAVVITAMVLSSCDVGSSNEESTSNEESASNEVTIGSQVWMTKNLDVSTFRNGDPIPEAKTDEEWKQAGENKQPAWCYYENDPANGTKYGKLYNWYAVNDSRGLALVGYHIPTHEEWTVLTDYLGGEDVAGKKMKSTSGWEVNGNGSNESGFLRLPCGPRFQSGEFGTIGYPGYWWDSKEDESYGYNSALGLNYGNRLSIGGYYDKATGFSVRCLRD